MNVTRPAVVLGSGQPATDIDPVVAAGRGYDVAARRSGGGAVLVGPAESVWIDFLIPVGDPLWRADIGAAAWWLGDLWMAVMAGFDLGPLEVWKGPLRPSRWSGQVCFAGLGTGEVLAGGRKVFGVSQRRTRQAALFQTATLLRWCPSELVALLSLDGATAKTALAELPDIAVGVGQGGAGVIWDVLCRLLMP